MATKKLKKVEDVPADQIQVSRLIRMITTSEDGSSPSHMDEEPDYRLTIDIREDKVGILIGEEDCEMVFLDRNKFKSLINTLLMELGS